MSDTKQVFAALVKAQRAFGPALKDKTNPAFRSKYADLGACLDAVMDALNANGIALVQKSYPHDGGVCIETVFVHESGESYSAGMLTVPATKQDAQGYGSAMTYARRYSVCAACGIAPEDDDGNAASKKPDPKAAPVKPAAQPPEPFDLPAWMQKLQFSNTAAELRANLAAAKEAAIAANNSAAYQGLRTEANKLAKLAGWDKAAKPVETFEPAEGQYVGDT